MWRKGESNSKIHQQNVTVSNEMLVILKLYTRYNSCICFLRFDLSDRLHLLPSPSDKTLLLLKKKMQRPTLFKTCTVPRQLWGQPTVLRIRPHRSRGLVPRKCVTHTAERANGLVMTALHSVCLQNLKEQKGERGRTTQTRKGKEKQENLRNARTAVLKYWSINCRRDSRKEQETEASWNKTAK